MKLCPQCEFIYEDDQSICDMDGKELVYGSSPLAFEGTVGFTSPATQEPAPVAVSLAAGLPATHPTVWQSRRSAVAALAAMILVALLFAVFYAETRQPRSGNAKQLSNETSNESSNRSTQPRSAATDLPTAPPEGFTTPAQPSSELPDLTMSAPSIATTNLDRGRVTSNPVSARSSAPDSRGPVIVWLKDGSSIKADEAWEKREGVWYRQAGMVTLVKRNRVRGIQRLSTPNPRMKSPTINSERQDRPSQSLIAQNQPRKVNAEVATVKKESRVTSFLKKTGRVLKKPFQF